MIAARDKKRRVKTLSRAVTFSPIENRVVSLPLYLSIYRSLFLSLSLSLALCACEHDLQLDLLLHLRAKRSKAKQSSDCGELKEIVLALAAKSSLLEQFLSKCAEPKF